MRGNHRALICLIAAAAALAARPAPVLVQTAAMPAADPQPGAAQRDGQRDFDVLVGTWKATLKRLVKPLSSSTTWIEFEGTQVTKSIWGGRATMDEFTVHSPATNTHIEGLTLRVYNPQARQWNIYWVNANRGVMDPAVTGQWKNGRGEFYGQDVYEGRTILVRYIWSDVTATSAHFEQSFSDDGGKTWEVNWISTITREKK